MFVIMLASLSYLIPVALYAADPTPTPPPASENLNHALSEMIVGVTTTAGQAKDFLIAQTPDVVRQLLYWKFAESVAWDVVAIFLFITIPVNATAFFRYGARNMWGAAPFGSTKEDDRKADAAVPSLMTWGLLGGLYTVIGTIVAFTSLNLAWLQIWLAPKVYLIEYAKTLLGH